MEERATRTAAAAEPAVAKPTGPVAAMLLSVALGSLALAVLVIWAETSESFADSLTYNDRVGPLSGKVIWAVGVFAASWLVLGLLLRRRNVPLIPVAVVSALLIALALVGTFSPFFELFAAEE